MFYFEFGLKVIVKLVIFRPRGFLQNLVELNFEFLHFERDLKCLLNFLNVDLSKICS